eukprot:3843985-Rhodomonas_salina.2
MEAKCEEWLLEQWMILGHLLGDSSASPAVTSGNSSSFIATVIHPPLCPTPYSVLSALTACWLSLDGGALTGVWAVAAEHAVGADLELRGRRVPRALADVCAARRDGGFPVRVAAREPARPLQHAQGVGGEHPGHPRGRRVAGAGRRGADVPAALGRRDAVVRRLGASGHAGVQPAQPAPGRLHGSEGGVRCKLTPPSPWGGARLRRRTRRPPLLAQALPGSVQGRVTCEWSTRKPVSPFLCHDSNAWPQAEPSRVSGSLALPCAQHANRSQLPQFQADCRPPCFIGSCDLKPTRLRPLQRLT